MRIFVNYILSYFQHDFKWGPHLLAGVFLAITISLNYWFDIYDTIQAAYKYQSVYILFLWFFYAVPFVLTTWFVSLFKTESKPIRNKRFLLFGLLGLFFLSLNSSYWLQQFIDPFLSENEFVQKWARSLTSNLSSLVTIIIPLYIIYYRVTYFKPEFYGLKLNGAKAVNYLWLILFMIPLIWLASYRPDFLETYPTYRDHFEYRFLQTDQWKTAGAYEFCYGFSFVSVELFFRGFMVVALSRFVGKDALLPMVVVYAFLHFGKPAGETISSIFGGYILGILSFQSRNIFGGLIAHLGVAWGMEYFAYLQRP